MKNTVLRKESNGLMTLGKGLFNIATKGGNALANQGGKGIVQYGKNIPNMSRWDASKKLFQAHGKYHPTANKALKYGAAGTGAVAADRLLSRD